MDYHAMVLDHGYIGAIEAYGSDYRIIEAARMSTAKGFVGWKKCSACGDLDPVPGTCTKNSSGLHHAEPADEKLLRYLYENKHSTPFEMAGLVIEVQAPILVFREWHRHRTQSYNEMSARYTPLPDLNYVPTVERLMLNSTTNKQAGTIKDALELTEGAAALFQNGLAIQYKQQEAFYQAALRVGVPKELARAVLPVGRYSKMRASANLRNWLQFLTLREAPNAQWEIRQYAHALNDILTAYFPRTMELFNEKKS